jgi:hypothetical protein
MTTGAAAAATSPAGTPPFSEVTAQHAKTLGRVLLIDPRINEKLILAKQI